MTPCCDSIVFCTNNPRQTLLLSIANSYTGIPWKQGALLGPSNNHDEMKVLGGTLVVGVRGFAARLRRLQYLAEMNPHLALSLDTEPIDTGERVIHMEIRRIRKEIE